MIENQDKLIQDLLDYYEKKSLNWSRKIIAEEKLARKNLEKERLAKSQKLENKRLLKEKRLEKKRLANEKKKKNKKFKKQNKIKNRKIEDNISLNIKVSNKGLFSMIEINQQEKMEFYIDGNKIKTIGFRPSVNKLACKFFKYYNDEEGIDGQYAKNGGERRVWYSKKRFYKLDFIDDKNKKIIEWNENGHYHLNGAIRKENLIRKGRVLFFYPDYDYVMIKENDYFPDGRSLNLGVKTRIFREILAEIDKKLKKI